MNAGADSLAVYSSSPVAFDQAFDQLHEACIDGDIAQVRQLVEAGHHVNEMDCFSYTPLMRAAMFGSAEICTYLLQNGANLSLVDKNTFTPLMLSAMWGHPRALEVLIKHKAPLDCVDRKYHMTALMWAASNTACVKLLLNHGADLSLKDVKGRTARDRAVEKFRHEIVELITHEEGERKKVKSLHQLSTSQVLACTPCTSNIQQLPLPASVKDHLTETALNNTFYSLELT